MSKRVPQKSIINPVESPSYGVNLRHYIAVLTEELGKIPEEYRNEATFEVDYERDYGDSITLNALVRYCRPLTQEEIDEEERQRIVRAREQIEYHQNQVKKLLGV